MNSDEDLLTRSEVGSSISIRTSARTRAAILQSRAVALRKETELKLALLKVEEEARHAAILSEEEAANANQVVDFPTRVPLTNPVGSAEGSYKPVHQDCPPMDRRNPWIPPSPSRVFSHPASVVNPRHEFSDQPGDHFPDKMLHSMDHPQNHPQLPAFPLPVLQDGPHPPVHGYPFIVKDYPSLTKEQIPYYPNMYNEAKCSVPTEVQNPHVKHLPKQEHAQFFSAKEQETSDGKFLEGMRIMADTIRQGFTLPKRDTLTFSGDPLYFHEFMVNFKNNIDSQSIDFGTKLDHLIHQCLGSARSAIQSCVIIQPPSAGYNKAIMILHERFGQQHQVVEAHLNEVCVGSMIKPNDSVGLDKLATQLRNCQITLRQWNYHASLDSQETLTKIFQRLPRHIQVDYSKRTFDLLKQNKQINFDDVVEFVEEKAKFANSHFGRLLSSSSKLHKQKEKPFKSSKPQKFTVGSCTTSQRSPQPNRRQYKPCADCGSKHPLWKCEFFKSKSIKDRNTVVRNGRLCFNCLSNSHFLKDCPSDRTCRIQNCGRRHHSLIHVSKSNRDDENRDSSNSDDSEDGNGAGVSTIVSGRTGCSVATHVRMKVVPVEVFSNSGNTVHTYAFIDSGSNNSLCSTTLFEQLRAKAEPAKFTLSTLNGNSNHVTSRVNIHVRGLKEKPVIHVKNVCVVDKLPDLSSSIPNADVINKCHHLGNIDFTFLPKNHVDLLIGADVIKAHEILEQRCGREGQPAAIHTIFGWTLFGPEDVTCNKSGKHLIQNNSISVNVTKDEDLSKEMKKMFNYDFPESVNDFKTALSIEDKRAEEMFKKSVQLVNGHYQLGLPWKRDNVVLPYNRQMALRRLGSLKRRLLADEEFQFKYKEKIQEYISNGHAIKIPDSATLTPNRTWYIPHHATSGKFRVVFDCAARYKGTSLNENLLQGPDYVNSLIGVLIRFRQDQVAVVGDIKAMYHQVQVRPSDRDAIRFLWWDDADFTKPPSDYQMQVHLFGARSSPSCASFALRKVADDNIPQVSAKVQETVRNSFYVDDLLKSFESVESANAHISQLSKLLHAGGFHLTKFLSNQRSFMESIPKEDRSSSLCLDSLDDLPALKTLGVTWNAEDDTFQVNVNITKKPHTRRGLLSMVSQVFDPLGFFQPFVLPMKQLMQHLCVKGLKWDDPLPEEAVNQWEAWSTSLHRLEDVHITRCFKPNGFSMNTVQLHIFCDASVVGYGVVAYLRMCDDQGKIHVTLVYGKSRVTPAKPMSVPRLELTAAVVAVKSAELLRRQLEYQLEDVYYWSDSTSVLHYISNTTSRYQIFVANRLALIHEYSLPSQWNYVKTTLNPADIASRGFMPHELPKANMWFFGPDFLRKRISDWPARPNVLPPLPLSLEIKSNITQAVMVNNQDYDTGIDRLIYRYSSYHRLQKAICWITKFKEYLLWKHSKSASCAAPSNVITVNDMQLAQNDLVRMVQEKCFGQVIKSLHNHKSFGDPLVLKPKKELRKSKLSNLRALQKLCPIVVKGLMYVGGRLQKSTFPHSIKHQLILPKKHHLTDLIIQHFHEEEGHTGILHVLASIRTKFWILKGQSAVRRVLLKCRKCILRRGKPGYQMMAPLPIARVTPGHRPFTFTGVDYMGPLFVHIGRSQHKRWVCVFTCLATRAVHLEIAASLDTSAFINAFRRFANRRGFPKQIFSDNGTNFVGADREIREEISKWNQVQIHENMIQKAVVWNFNPPGASHQGGIWERIIRSIRHILKIIAANRRLTEEDLSTFIVEVERILNDRPITPMTDDVRDSPPLKPSSILTGHLDDNLPPGKFINADGYRRSWRKTQLLADEFWEKWVKDYLPMLQKRQKWFHPARNLAIGDIVLMLGESTKRGVWPKGIIKEVLPDKDGIVRRVIVKTSTSTFTRDIRKICLLEPISN